ncbi:MAG: hypothetical protein L7S56_00990 [Candidatus Poseidonia sp.]|nr:hypothetical protein [Poseidonia sp.]
MAETQGMLDTWFLQQDIIDQLLASGEEREDAEDFSQRILAIASTEEAEHQSLHDPFDRSVALVLSLVREEAFNPWDVDLAAFLQVFTERVQNEADSLDLPACGRLIRLSWEVLHHQSSTLFDRIQNDQEEEEWDEGFSFGWEADYDDEAYMFTQSILDGAADDLLPTLFDERVRRDEGRPVTLGELLSAFKAAADDAEELKLREHNRLEHEKELAEYLANVDGRMHNEDLEGDIERCWNAMRAACAESGQSKVPLVDVIGKLKPVLSSMFGERLDDPDGEAMVASFIAGLFLTHRRMASISQDGEVVESIMIEDLWPKISTFDGVLDHIEVLMAEDSEGIADEATGSVHRLEAIAERARIAEERAARKQARLDAQEMPAQDTPVEDSLGAHDWLVE